MNDSPVNRRDFLSYFAVGGVGLAVASYPVTALANVDDLKAHIIQVVTTHWPQLGNQQQSVDAFAVTLCAPGWKGLESREYLLEKFRRREFAELDRLILIEYALTGNGH